MNLFSYLLTSVTFHILFVFHPHIFHSKARRCVLKRVRLALGLFTPAAVKEAMRE